MLYPSWLPKTHTIAQICGVTAPLWETYVISYSSLTYTVGTFVELSIERVVAHLQHLSSWDDGLTIMVLSRMTL